MMELNLLEKKVLDSKTPKKNGFLRKAANYLMIAVAATWGVYGSTISVGCSPGSDEKPRVTLDEGNDSVENDSYQGDDDVVEGDDDDSYLNDDTIGDDDVVDNETPYDVRYIKDIGKIWECIDQEEWDTTACNCTKYLEEYPSKEEVIPYTNKITLRQLENLMQGLPLINDLPPSRALTPNEISDAVNISFLTNNKFNKRKLTAYLVNEEEKEGYLRREFILEDDLLGTTRVLYLTPKGEDNFPIVLASHGHMGNPDVFENYLHGKDYPANGYGIVIPTYRAMCNEENEFNLAKELLLNGTPQMGLHTLDGLNALKLAKDLYYLEKGKEVKSIGFVGNSSGGSINNIIARLTPEAKALVLDVGSRYNEGGFAQIPSTSCPSLYLLSNSLTFTDNLTLTEPAYFNNAPFPVMQLPNEGLDPEQQWGDLQNHVFNFFAQNL